MSQGKNVREEDKEKSEANNDTDMPTRIFNAIQHANERMDETREESKYTVEQLAKCVEGMIQDVLNQVNKRSDDLSSNVKPLGSRIE